MGEDNNAPPASIHSFSAYPSPAITPTPLHVNMTVPETVPIELFLIIATYSLSPIKPLVNASSLFTTILKEANSDSHTRFNRVVASKHKRDMDPSVHKDKKRISPKRHWVQGERDLDIVEVKEFAINECAVNSEACFSAGFVVLRSTLPEDGMPREVVVHPGAYSNPQEAFWKAAEMADACSETEYKATYGKLIQFEDRTDGEVTFYAQWVNLLIEGEPMVFHAWFDVVRVMEDPKTQRIGRYPLQKTSTS